MSHTNWHFFLTVFQGFIGKNYDSEGNFIEDIVDETVGEEGKINPDAGEWNQDNVIQQFFSSGSSVDSKSTVRKIVRRYDSEGNFVEDVVRLSVVWSRRGGGGDVSLKEG